MRTFPALPTTIAAITLAVAAPTGTRAQESPKVTGDQADHPAAKVVVTYLGHALRRDWANATKLIDQTSLQQVLANHIDRIKGAATIDDEMRMVRELGKDSVAEVERMPPTEFYAAYHKALQDRYNLTEARIATIASTIDLDVLAVGEEGDDLAHVLVRTQHEDGDNLVRNLELISLIKRDDKWVVALDQQGPQLTPLAEPNRDPQ